MIWIPRHFSAFLAGLCGTQVFFALAFERPLWTTWIMGAIAIWAVISWRVAWKEDSARWKRNRDEILDRIRRISR